MALPNVPKLTRGMTSWTGSLPCTWTERVARTGGGEIAANGTPSNYVIATFPLLDVVLRIAESEWSTLASFLLDADAAGASFTFQPDKDVVGTTFTVYLESPSVRFQEDLRYQRDEGDPGTLLVPITLRRTSATPFALPLYPEPS